MSNVSVEELTSKKCQPCHGGVPPVPKQEAEQLIAKLPGWRITDDGIHIRRESGQFLGQPECFFDGRGGPSLILIRPHQSEQQVFSQLVMKRLVLLDRFFVDLGRSEVPLFL